MTKRFPWYESYWLEAYCRTRQFLADNYPDRLADFDHLLRPLKTDPTFKASLQRDLLTGEEFQAIKASVADIDRLDLDQVDLYLVHWPVPERRHEAWRAMERIAASAASGAVA